MSAINSNSMFAAADAAAAANAASSAGTGSSSSSSSTDPTAKLANEDTFLKLMVAQLRNQDPLQPTDGTQFLGQLAQFSQLEQLIGLRQDVKGLTPSQSSSTDTSTTDTSNTNKTSGTSAN